MQMFPDDLPLANIDADGYCCHFMRSSVRPTIHGLGFVYCIQSAWKKWPTIWHADVSMAMEMGNIELMVKLQVFTYIHDQRVIWLNCLSFPCPQLVNLYYFEVKIFLIRGYLWPWKWATLS